MKENQKISLQQLLCMQQEFREYSYDEISNFFISNENNEDVIEDLNSSKQILIITGGIAAGKSTVAYNLIKNLNLKNFLFVSTDTFYYARFAKGDNFNMELYNLARKYTDEKIYEHISKGKSFVWETVFSKEKKFTFLQRCKELGYKINTIFVGEESPEIQIERSNLRAGMRRALC